MDRPAPQSTLIRCINRLEEHQDGKIIVDGNEMSENTKNIEEIRAEVGMVFSNLTYSHTYQFWTIAP